MKVLYKYKTGLSSISEMFGTFGGPCRGVQGGAQRLNTCTQLGKVTDLSNSQFL